jgi:hypothetical protein
MQGKGLSERRALKVVRMSASSLRYEPSPDKNVALRQAIVKLTQRHRRYGSEMIYLKLRQAGEQVNHKRVERLYTQEGLQVRRRQHKKIPVSERQPLVRPGAANKVWSMDFVFDRVSTGRALLFTLLHDRLLRAAQDADLLGFGADDLASIAEPFRNIPQYLYEPNDSGFNRQYASDGSRFNRRLAAEVDGPGEVTSFQRDRSFGRARR